MRYDEVSIYGVDINGNRKVVKVEPDGTVNVTGGSGGGSASPATPSSVQLSDGTIYYKALSEGTASDGVVGPTGGSGALKWLSGIWSLINSRLMPAATTTPYLGTSNGANLKVGAGSVFAITISNNNAAVRYFQLFEKVTAPALNDVPVRSFPVYANDGLLIIGQDIIGGTGIALATGISWGFSSTRLTFTAATALDTIVTVRWS